MRAHAVVVTLPLGVLKRRLRGLLAAAARVRTSYFHVPVISRHKMLRAARHDRNNRHLVVAHLDAWRYMHGPLH